MSLEADKPPEQPAPEPVTVERAEENDYGKTTEDNENDEDPMYGPSVEN